ncbi:MAG: hypothetical protein OT477_17255 [Chloroflexi bacterium]|nr:hypothetical protein [Chloroflexota bacterium]
MDEQQHNSNASDLKVLLYLAIVVSVFFCTCAGFNLVIYGIPQIKSIQLGASQHIDGVVMLIVVNGIIVTFTGLLSNVIAGWISEQIQREHSSRKTIIAVTFILIFVVLISVEVLIAIFLAR